jgi:glycerol kinase
MAVAGANESILVALKKRGTFTAAIDQGTTSSRFLIFDGSAVPLASHQVEFKQHYPHPG